MIYKRSNKVINILNVGISLEESGINNWALTLNQALVALEQLYKSKIPVLGGDVCEEINGTIEYNYDNWYSDKLENDNEFLERSFNESSNYIKNYCKQTSNKIYFVLVPYDIEEDNETKVQYN